MEKKKVSDLINHLERVVLDVKHDKKVVGSIKDVMFNRHKVMRGEVQRIFMGREKLETLSEKTLVAFAFELFRETNVTNISPYNYFDEEVVKNATETVDAQEIIQIHNNEFPIVLNNVDVAEDGKAFNLSIDGRELMLLYNSNLLEYNYEINKKYKFTPTKVGKLVQTLDINLKEARKIAKEIVKKTYKIRTIVLNILKDSAKAEYNTDQFEYDGKKLTIYKSKIDIVTGLMDITALNFLYEENPNFKLNIELEIRNDDITDIKKYFNKLNIKGVVN